MPRSLAQKLLLSLTVIVILIESGSGYINVRTQERQLLDTMIVGVDQLSKGITSATWHAMLADDRDAAYEVMQTIALKQGIDRIRMFNREGQMMFSTAREDLGRRLPKDSETCIACHGAGQPKQHVSIPSRVRQVRGADGRRNLIMVTPIYNEPSCSEAACHAHPAATKVLGVLEVSLNLDPVDREMAGMKLRVFGVTCLQILLISVFIYFFTRRFLVRPIRRLIEGTHAVSEMNLDQPIVISGSSQELDALAHSFNVMQKRLQQAIREINESAQDLENKVERRTEQLRAAHQKLLQSDRLASLGQLAASVAHEINNPISGVLNLSMLMQRILKDDGIPPERLPDFRKYLGQVVSETTRVGRIVSDLLAFSRRSKPQRADADLNRIVRSTLSLVSHKLKLANVEVELALGEDLPPVCCDASQIQQVVLNLVLNGAEAMQVKGAGRLHISTGVAADRGALLFTVRDSGEGIRPENLARIFDPFFTTKGEGKGVGLGLAVSYGIVQEHGGEIEVQSRIGEGTALTVRLPLVSPEAAGAEAAGAARA